MLIILEDILQVNHDLLFILFSESSEYQVFFNKNPVHSSRKNPGRPPGVPKTRGIIFNPTLVSETVIRSRRSLKVFSVQHSGSFYVWYTQVYFYEWGSYSFLFVGCYDY